MSRWIAVTVGYCLFVTMSIVVACKLGNGSPATIAFFAYVFGTYYQGVVKFLCKRFELFPEVTELV